MRKTALPSEQAFCGLRFAQLHKTRKPVGKLRLRTTQTRHLDQVPQQQPAHGFRLFLVLLRPQGPFYPAVNLFPVQRPKANSLAGRQKPLDLLDCERLGSLHCHLHRPAVSPVPPTPIPFRASASSCVRNARPPQHHLVLEKTGLLLTGDAVKYTTEKESPRSRLLIDFYFRCL